MADFEFKGDLGSVVLRLTDHARQTLKAFQHLFLTVGHFALNLSRCCTKPVGRNGQHRLSHIGGKLNRDGLQSNEAEQEDHHHCGDHGDRPRDGEANEIHLGAGHDNILAGPEAFIAADNRQIARF